MDETEQNPSLDLDIERARNGQKSHPVARIAVVGTRALTRDGGHVTITSDCASAAALEREIERLHGELDHALERGRATLGERAGSAAKQRAARGRAPAPVPASSPAKPRLSLPWTVADVMTRDVRTVGANDPVAAAKALMDSGGFRHVVVVDEEGAIEGVLSHRDLFSGPLAWSIGQGQAAYQKLLNASRVKDLMRGDVVTIDATASLQEAAGLMRERKIGCLPVVAGDRLTGILTDGDFVDLIAESSRERV